MALSPKKICNHPGCGKTQRGSYCEHHQPIADERKRAAQARRVKGNTTRRGYGHDWRKIRGRYIKTHPLCAHCELIGKVTPAVQVDHIKPFAGQNDPLRITWDNLQSLCIDCHAKKTAGSRNRDKQKNQATPTTARDAWERLRHAR